MIKSFTAADARKLAGPTVEDRVNDVLDLIKIKAANGGHEIALRDDFWVNEGYGNTGDYRRACTLLEGLGFNVKFYYIELQFVDMYTIVEW